MVAAAADVFAAAGVFASAGLFVADAAAGDRYEEGLLGASLHCRRVA